MRSYCHGAIAALGLFLFIGRPAAAAPSNVPVLSGLALSSSSIQWSWTLISGATGYTLYDTPSSAILYGPAGSSLTFTSSTLTANTRYDAQVEANFSTSPTSARSLAFTYTLANVPSNPTLLATYTSSMTFAWDSNQNPAGTFYQVLVATESTYSIVVSTLSISLTTITVTGLFPGVTYYCQVRAINGVQTPTAYVALPTTATNVDSQITTSSTSINPYLYSNGLVGSWQFDVGSGTTAVDASTFSNSANITCVSAGCTSTPTWTTGPVGLGSALSYTGLSGAVLTTSTSPFAFTDDLTVSAWVKPQTSAQQNGAGIVARGNLNSEDFALDVYGGAYRFIAQPSKIATAPNTVPVGQWTHVVGVYDATAQTATLYLNGSSVATVTSVVAPRSDSGQVLSIGNRPNITGARTLSFFGDIDSVRVFHRALSSGEVLSDYYGSLISSVTPPSPNNGVILAIPPNAFGAPVQFFISNDPLGHPIRIPAATLTAGLSSSPSGLTLVPNSLFEIVPVVGGVPFTTTLGSSATLTIPYRDTNRDNLVDNTNPPLAASGIQLYTLNTTVNRWELLPTSVDSVNRRATGVTTHFSVFALFAPTTVGVNVSNVRVYPIPWKPGSGGIYDASYVTFANLPSAGTVRILTLAGDRVREIPFSGASAGTARWDGFNDNGQRAASGVYFARIVSSADNTSSFIKFAVER